MVNLVYEVTVPTTNFLEVTDGRLLRNFTYYNLATNFVKAELSVLPGQTLCRRDDRFILQTRYFVMLRHSFIAILFVLSASAFVPTWTARAQNAGNQDTSAQKQQYKLEEVPLKQAEARHKPGDTVAVVNGVLITFADFNSIMAGYLKSIVARTKNNVVNDTLYTEVVDSAWDRAVSDIIIEQEITKRKLRMPSGEIKEWLATNPPDYLRQQFTDSLGKFHEDAMRTALNDPRNDTVVEVLVEGTRIPLETKRLVFSIAKKGASPTAAANEFEVWLKKAKRSATIDDRRTRFGFY